MMIEDFAPGEVKWCKTCASHKQGVCDDCGKTFHQGEPKFKSLTHHFHPTSIAGVPGTMAIYLSLCAPCSEKDHADYYDH